MEVAHIGMSGVIAPKLHQAVRQRHRDDRVRDPGLNGIQLKIGRLVQHFESRLHVDGFPLTIPRFRPRDGGLPLQYEVEQLKHEPRICC